MESYITDRQLIEIYDGRFLIKPDSRYRPVILSTVKTTEIIGIVLANIIKGDTKPSSWISVPDEELKIRIAVDNTSVVFQFYSEHYNTLYKMTIPQFLYMSFQVFEYISVPVDNEHFQIDTISRTVAIPDDYFNMHELTEDEVQFLEHILYFLLVSNPLEISGLFWLVEDNTSRYAFVNHSNVEMIKHQDKQPFDKVTTMNLARLWLGIISFMNSANSTNFSG